MSEDAHGFARLKICGTCIYKRSPVCLSLKLVQACSKISQNPEQVSAATLNALIQEAEALSRRKYKCSRESNAWMHLVDKACAFWQPKEKALLS